MIGYALKNGKNLTYDIFPYRKDAVKHAQYNVSNHPKMDWKSVYEIVKVEITELDDKI